jgi:GT2 family glycosyltransferase
VVICSRERPALLLDTVRSVLDGDSLPQEVVVVDQSAAPNAEVAALDGERGCRVLYIPSATRGSSRARNIGMRAASGQVLVMLDDDMFVAKDWLATLLDGMPGGRHGVATGRVLAAPAEGAVGAIPPAALVERDTAATYRGVQKADVIPGANVAVPRELMLRIGGYDDRLGPGTRFGAAEDNDIGHRLLRAGAEVRHVPEAVVLHRAWRAQGELLRLRWRYARGKGAFYAKHLAAGDRHIRGRLVAEVGRRLRRAVSALVRSPRRTAAELLSVAGIVCGAAEWLVREGISGRRGAAP